MEKYLKLLNLLSVVKCSISVKHPHIVKSEVFDYNWIISVFILTKAEAIYHVTPGAGLGSRGESPVFCLRYCLKLDCIFLAAHSSISGSLYGSENKSLTLLSVLQWNSGSFEVPAKEGAIGYPYTLLWRFWTAEELVFA